MNIYMLLSAFIVTAGSMLLLRPVAARVGLLDMPGGRKTHKSPTPMIGGLGIYLGTLSICMLSPVIAGDLKTLLIVSGFVLAIGVIDDLYELSASLRMAGHAIAAWAMAIIAGTQIQSFGDLFFTGPILLGALSLPVTLFATVGVINAINMSDGLDGLSGGLVTVTLVLLSVAAIGSGESAILNFNQILIVTLLAFLAFNFRLLWKKSALVYLGDAGSTLLGFIVAWLVIAATQGEAAFISPVTALWLLAVPLIDTVSLLIRRPLQGRSPFNPGRDHLHHRLLNAGLDAKQTVLTIHGLALICGSIGLLGHFADAPDGLMFMLFMALFAVYMQVSKRVLTIPSCSASSATSEHRP